MPEHHAVLGPSSAHRWMTCPASVKASAGIQRPGSYSAEEGTRAHELAELTASLAFGLIDPQTYKERFSFWNIGAEDGEPEEMAKHASAYVDLLTEQQKAMGSQATIHLEQRVYTGVPECWGTADAVIVTPTTIHVTDLKYGAGVWVDAEDNPQLMLYGVGALEAYDLLGDIQEVRMTIFQPRMDNVSTVVVSAENLRAWRDLVIPIAEDALGDDAEFHPSESACRFCPIAGDCKPRMEFVTRQDFFNDPNLLDADEMAGALKMAPHIRAWLTALEERALERAYANGEVIPGWKVVMSGGKRQIADPAVAIQTLIDAGYTAEQVSKISTKTLGDLEKLVGKDRLPEILGDLLQKTPGRQALVPEDDKRPSVNKLDEARADFSK